MLVFEKTDTEERFLVLVNVRNKPCEVKIPEEWVGHESQNMTAEAGVKLESTLKLNPFEYLILKY